MLRRPALAACMVVVAAISAQAETYTIDLAHSHVAFSVRHMMISKVPGKFEDFSGTIHFDPADTSKWSVAVTIKTASINTGVVNRDNHLRSPDFFAADSFPTITFQSTKIVPKGGDKFDIVGNLTIRGVTKPVTLNAEMLGMVEDPRMGKRIGFAATTTIDRMDFGASWNKTLETGGLVVGHDVNIDLGVEAYIPKP